MEGTINTLRPEVKNDSSIEDRNRDATKDQSPSRQARA